MSQWQNFLREEELKPKHAGGRVVPSSVGSQSRPQAVQAPQSLQVPRQGPQRSQAPPASQAPQPPQIYQVPPVRQPQMTQDPESQVFQGNAISRGEDTYQQSSRTNGEGANQLPNQRLNTCIRVAVQPIENAQPIIEVRNDHRHPGVRTAPRRWQRGHLNIFRVDIMIRLKRPFFYLLPSVGYPRILYTNRDALGRKHKGREDDRYVSEKDLRMRKLLVQATDDVYDNKDSTQTWRRTFIRNKGPWMLRLAYWPLSALSTDIDSWSASNWGILFLKWILSCTGMFFALLWFDFNQAFKEGMYNPFCYRLREYPKTSRNVKEDNMPHRTIHEDGTNLDIKHERLLRPHTLCYLQNPESQDRHGIYNPIYEEERNKGRPINDRNLPYLFVSFTSEHFRLNSPEDIDDLHEISEMAARRANLPAYWVSCSCMSEDMAGFEQDVYRINDVIRGANSMIIAIGHPQGSDGVEDEDTLLRTWGRRVWTLPEALLCTRTQDIEVYTRGKDHRTPRILSKTELARTAWHDGEVARQLVNHYDGSLALSRLELMILALKCLRARDAGEKYLDGDLAYTLMGLLRRRPRVDRTDSEFQAFARLSLANDSDRLLERMICMLPRWGGDWLTADDAWGANLWDIYPACQVSAIGNSDTVVLDGCYAAAIRWKSFVFVGNCTKASWSRLLARGLLRIYHLGTIITCIFYKPLILFLGPSGFIVIILLLLLVLASPYFVKVLYGGKFWNHQPWLFGFEGYMDIETIESQIFGYAMGRLSWSPAGSPLSRHRPNKYGECVGVDPTLYDDGVKRAVEQATVRGIGEPRIFTVVDTYTMTVTLFEAVRPPVMVLLCGSEGGMQRAVMCSYDWKSQTLSRESVLRMETPVLDKMWRIGRVKFGFQKSYTEAQGV